MRWREAIARFMVGRYGSDAFSRAMSVVAMVFLLLSWFVLPQVFYTLALILIVYSTFRMFSINHQKRYKENLFYTKQVDKVKYFINKLKYRSSQSKTHHIYSCPQCKQKIRVPKGKGKIMIRCPKCQTEFMKKS